MFSVAQAQDPMAHGRDVWALETPSVPVVFSASVFGPALARALDGLLAVQAHDAELYKSSPVEKVALCGALCLRPRGDDFYAADQLSRHYYASSLVPVAFVQIPGLADALGGLNALDIRRMLKERWEAMNGI